MQLMFQNESFDSYEHFVKMIQKESLPSGFISVSGINCMYFHYVKHYDGLTVAPSLLASFCFFQAYAKCLSQSFAAGINFAHYK